MPNFYKNTAYKIQPRFQHLLFGGRGGWRLGILRWSAAAVDHPCAQQGDHEAQQATEDGEQGEGSSRLDVSGQRDGRRLSPTLHLTRGLKDAVQPQTVPHLQEEEDLQ